MNSSSKKIFQIAPGFIGKRIDKFLAYLFSDLSLRGVRRLITEKNCLVNARVVSPAYKLKKGDVLEIYEKDYASPVNLPRIIFQDNDFSFYFKPALIHSAKIIGKNNFSFEDWLGEQDFTGYPLQRLDFGTCGIITCANNHEAKIKFRDYEKSGLCDKFYLCLLENSPSVPFIVKKKLDTNNRKKTLIKQKENSNPIRITQFYPLPNLTDFAKTWSVARIKQGQRHQIRAHAAAAGYPLAGDQLYGGKGENYFLWNFYLKFPDYKITSPKPSQNNLPDLSKIFNVITNWKQIFNE